MFCGFIWSPIFNYHEDILTSINNQYNVEKYYIYDFKSKNLEYEQSILDIYTTDDISQDKVKNVKIKNMNSYPKKFVYFIFDIHEPNYRLKKDFNTQISTKVEILKKNIRNIYKNKVSNYIHDITIHISDNTTQSKQISELITKYKQYIISEKINLKTFLKYQFDKNIFTRVDTLVRKYSIEQYLKNKEYDFALYNKMQTKRINSCTSDKFKKLIDNILTNGFNSQYPIEYENNYMLRNGSHRLSFLYLKKNVFIPISPLINYKSEGKYFCNYKYDWFKDKFTQKELNIIKKEINDLDIYLNGE